MPLDAATDRLMSETAALVMDDALTHDRVCRPALPEEKACDIMRRGGGTPFAPQLLTVFLLHLEEMIRICEQNPDKSPATLAHPFIPGALQDCAPQPRDLPGENIETR